MDATLQDPYVGRVLDGRYRVESRVARGGMATVYVARDLRLEREIALKIMHDHLADDPEFVERFLREARSAAKLSHPNVVQVFDQGSDGLLLYLAMEYLPGRTLREVIVGRGALTPREALSVLEPVLDALAAAHRAGIVHRDVKPENVILTDDGRIKVADFGLARAATGSNSTSGALIGTAAYLSPELVAQGVTDSRTDVYAAGILLFEMLTGQQPFTGDLPIQVAFRHVHDQVPPPSRFAPGLPAELDELVARATAHDPAGRPADAAALLRVVRAVRAALPEESLDRRRAGRHAGPPARGETQNVDRDVVHRDTQVFPPAYRSRRRMAEIPTALPARPQSRRRAPMDPAAKRRLQGQLMLAAALVLALLIGIVGWWVTSGPGSFVPTPKVTGLTAENAQQKLAEVGLETETELAYHSKVREGRVISTDPAPGEQVRKNGTVVLTVSRGPQLVTVPPVAGLSLRDAIEALQDAKLVKGETLEGYDDEVPEGFVISAQPASGQKATIGSTVNLVVSQGAEKRGVPDVRGLRRDEAERRLTEAGFVPAPEVHNDNGRVVQQEPIGGEFPPGTSVRIVIAEGQTQGTVPDVTNRPFREARRILRQAGYRNVRQFGFGDTVWNQQPGAGTPAPLDQTITLFTR